MLESPPRISVVSPDGAVSPFELDRLHLSVLQAFVRSDTPENYLAEDVALAVEYALNSSGRSPKTFTESEINSAVIRILEETGLIEAARYFRKRNRCVNLSLSARRQAVRDLLARHLSTAEAGDDLDALADTVTAAIHKLNISEAAPALYLELARHYQNNRTSPVRIEVPKPPASDREFIGTGELLACLNSGQKKLVESGVIQLTPISRRVFPTARIVFRLSRFAGTLDISPPITEMMISGALHSLSGDISGLIGAIQRHYLEATGNRETLPAYVFVPDLEEFAAGWLDWSWPEAKKECLELLAPLGSPAYKLHCD